MAVGVGLTVRQYNNVRKLLCMVHTGRKRKFSKRWKKSRISASLDKPKAHMPSPQTVREVNVHACGIADSFGLCELPAAEGNGARFDTCPVLQALASRYDAVSSPLHVQILGDGFRALKLPFLNIGARVLHDSEIENSFTALATM